MPPRTLHERTFALLKMLGICLGSLVLSVVSANSSAQDKPDEDGVAVELNKVETRQGACRTHFVVRNRTQRRFTAFKVDLVFFDKKDVVSQRLVFNLAPLRPGKTTVLLFDIPDADCAELSKALVNDVTECTDEQGAHEDCVGLVEPSSRTSISLIK